jgi:hypothetical protein
MTTHFLTPLLNEFTERLNAKVAEAEASIVATLRGVTAATPSTPHPRSKSKAKRPRGRK